MAGIFNLDVGGKSLYTVKPAQYAPYANLQSVAQANQLKSPATLGQIDIGRGQDFLKPEQLKQEIYQGLRQNILHESDLANKRLQETMAKAGLFRSGLTLDNQRELEGKTLQALGSAWSDTALNVAKLQSDLAKSQAELDYNVRKYNTDVQNAWRQKNYDYLMNAAAQDQDAINKARQFNVSIQNAYDELAFKWAASLLDQEIREYAAKLDMLAKVQAANAQFGTSAAKNQWNTLAYRYAR